MLEFLRRTAEAKVRLERRQTEVYRTGMATITFARSSDSVALPGTVVAVCGGGIRQAEFVAGVLVLSARFGYFRQSIFFVSCLGCACIQASMEQLDPTLDQAAASLGARAWQRFTRVTLPLVWPGAVAGTLLAFVIALGEYVASVLVFVPANRPISVAIASELRDFNLGAAAAYGVVLIVIIALSMAVAGRLERLRG